MNLPKQCKKRSLAILLALAVFFTYSLPMSAFAEDSTNNSAKVEHNGEPKYYKEDGQEGDANNYVVKTSKTIEKLGGENEFKISLNVETKDGVETTTEAQDAAVVLVMDVSGSMKEKINNETRLAIAKEQAKKFLDNYAKNAKGHQRYVSIVQFASDATRVGEKNVDITQVENLNKVKTNIDKNVTVPSNLERAGTDIEAGLLLAKNILNDANLKKIAYKSVILLTDGAPTVPVGNTSDNNDSFIEQGEHHMTGNVTNKEDVDDIPQIVTDIKKSGATIYAISFAYDKTNIAVCANSYAENQSDEWHKISKKPVNVANGTATLKSTIPGKWRTDEYYEDLEKEYCGRYKNGSNPKEYTKWWEKLKNPYLTKDVKTLYEQDFGVNSLYNASNSSELMKVFENIQTEVESRISASGLVVTDPMGSFIKFDETSIQNIQGAKFKGNTLTWNPSEPTNENKNNGTKSYILQYKVKLDVEKDGFEEDKDYATNGITTLEYTYNGKKQKVEFDVPKVKGKLPEYAYTVKHMVRNTENEEYQQYQDDQTDTIKKGTEIKPLEGKIAAEILKSYTCDNYANDAKVTISKNNQVITVYYTKNKYNVKVNYILDITYKNEGKADTCETYTEASPENFEAVLGSNLQDGGTLKYGGKEYAPAEEKSRFSSKVPSVCEFVKLEEKDDKSLSNVKSDVEVKAYYKCTVDNRYKTDVQLDVVYRDGKWVLNPATKRYEHRFDDSQDTTNSKQYKSATKLVNGETASFTVANSDTYKQIIEKKNVDNYAGGVADVVAVADKEGTPTKAKLILGKPLEKNDSNIPGGHTEISIKHKYVTKGKKIENGRAVDFEQSDGEEIIASELYWKGEVFKLEARPKTNEYKMDLGDDGKNTTYEKYKEYTVQGNEGVDGKLNIEITYTKSVMPEKANLKVHHKLVKYKKIADDEGKITEVEISDKDDLQGPEYMADKFAGEVVSVSKASTNYSLIKDKSRGSNSNLNINDDGTMHITLVTGDNEVTLYYKDSNVAEGRKKAAKNVYHEYSNKVVELEENEPKTITKTEKSNVQKEGEYVGDIVTIRTKEQCEIGTDLFKNKEFKFVGYKEGNAQEITPITKTEFEAKTFTILNENADITLVYERDQKDTKLETAKFKVTHEFFRNVWKAILGVAKWVRPDEPTEKEISLSDDKIIYYVGQKVVLEPKQKVDYTLDGEKKTEELKKTEIEGNLNEFTYKYDAKLDSDKPKPVQITVKHVYKLEKISEDGTITTDNSYDDTANDTYERYLDEIQKTEFRLPVSYSDIKVTAKANVAGIVPDGYDGKTPIEINVPNTPVELTYTYTAEDNKAILANFVVREHYKEVYADGRIKESTPREKTGSRYKGNTITTKLLENDIYEVYDIKVSGGKLVREDKHVKLILAEGENTLDIYYKNRTGKENQDGRTKYTIIRNYYKRDISGIVKYKEGELGTAVATGVTDGTSELTGYQNNPVKIDDKLKDRYNKHSVEVVENGETKKIETTYETVTVVKPEGGKKLDLKQMSDAADNVIELNYVHDYNALDNVKFTIHHIYKIGEEVVDTKKVEATRTSADYGTWDEQSKKFTAKLIHSDGYYVVTPYNDYTNVDYGDGNVDIKIEYQYRPSGRKPEPNGGNTGGVDNNKPTNPSTTIDDNKVPLGNNLVTEIPDGEVPLANAPAVVNNNQDIEILDGKVPLAGLPKTGGYGVAGIVVLGGMLALAGIYLGRKKEQ